MDIQEYWQFLEQQLFWCKEQDGILVRIEMILYEMKEIAQNVLDYVLTKVELEQLNVRLNIIS